MTDSDEHAKDFEEAEEATEEEWLAAGLTESEDGQQPGLVQVSCGCYQVLARLGEDGLPLVFEMSWRKGRGLQWSDETYWEHAGAVPADAPKGLARACGSSLDPKLMEFILRKIEAYPMYEKNFGKAGQRVNVLDLRKEGTYRQGNSWVFDDAQRGLRSEPFLCCDTKTEEAVATELALASLGNRAWTLDSPIEEVAIHLGLVAGRVRFTFSANRFAGFHAVLRRATVDSAWPFATYEPAASRIGRLKREWHFEESLAMFFRRFPRRIYFRLESRPE